MGFKFPDSPWEMAFEPRVQSGFKVPQKMRTFLRLGGEEWHLNPGFKAGSKFCRKCAHFSGWAVKNGI